MLLVGVLYLACFEAVNTVPLNCAGDGLALYNLLFYCLLGSRYDQAGLELIELAIRFCIACMFSALRPSSIELVRPTFICNNCVATPFSYPSLVFFRAYKCVADVNPLFGMVPTAVIQKHGEFWSRVHAIIFDLPFYLHLESCAKRTYSVELGHASMQQH